MNNCSEISLTKLSNFTSCGFSVILSKEFSLWGIFPRLTKMRNNNTKLWKMCPINVGIVRQFYHIIDVFGPLLRTRMSYEAMKRVFFLALPDGFVVKVLVANPILLYCVSYHGEKCSNQGARSSPLGPALHIALIMIFLLSR